MKEKVETMGKNIGKKNLIIAIVFVVAIIIIIFGGALIYNKFFYKKSYAEVEAILIESTKEYMRENKSLLPNKANDSYVVTEDMLVGDKIMNTTDSYIKNKNTTCTGEVVVTNINGNYRYVAKLDCGEEYYKTKTFNDYILENVKVVETENGLYKTDETTLTYRGDEVNNYLSLNNKIYRIVKFKDGYPVIIYTDKLETTLWDDRYNVERDDPSGINDYEVSRIRNFLHKLYTKTGANALLSNSNKLLVVKHDVPIGKRSNEDADKTGATENAKILTEQYISLLPVSDFLNASIDTNCVDTLSKSCGNYNYLSKYRYNWWTGTASSKNSYNVFRVKGKGTVSVATASSDAHVRFVLHLAKDTIYVSGKGTYDDPYIVK